jgi:uncharacterized sporulation protein YeaH/YhbH (DUF444 family)
VFLLLDVSGSMTERDRQLAKTFFFWVVAGLRREYRHLDTVFVAHTTEAWEFNEADFFKVTGSGGTVTSTGFAKVREIAAGALQSGQLQRLPLLRLGRRQRLGRSRAGAHAS